MSGQLALIRPTCIGRSLPNILAHTSELVDDVKLSTANSGSDHTHISEHDRRA